ncbi:hypothetical protein DFH28DRAFT_861329, partial [Melampsora americana]
MSAHHFVTRTRPHIDLLAIKWCQSLDGTGVCPKEIMYAFLTSNDDVLKYRRGKWKADGWASTLDILHAIMNLANERRESSEAWRAFILAEAQECIKIDLESKPRSYFSSNKIDPGFFDTKQMEAREANIKSDMPFLYSLVYNQLSNATAATKFLTAGGPSFDTWDDMERNEHIPEISLTSEGDVDVENSEHDEIEYVLGGDSSVAGRNRALLVSRTNL